LKVKKVYISKQVQSSKNYEKFSEITKNKKIKVNEVIEGDRLYIEKNLYFDVIWPTNKQLKINVLNNNSIVLKINYKKYIIFPFESGNYSIPP